MRAQLLLTALFLAIGTAAAAQTDRPLVGSVSVGPAFWQGLPDRPTGFLFGGGLEVRPGPLALGGEVTYLNVPKTSSRVSAISLTAISFKASYYPGRLDNQRVRGFSTAGATVYLPTTVAGQGAGSLDVGGGFDWWAARRAGIRVDIRAQLPNGVFVRFGPILR